MSLELIAEVLAAHPIDTADFRRHNGWGWWCGCHVDGEEVLPDGEAARQAGARHQAEQVWEALEHGAPGAEPETSSQATAGPVPTAGEVV